MNLLFIASEDTGKNLRDIYEIIT